MYNNNENDQICGGVAAVDEIAKAHSKSIYEFLFQNSDPDDVRHMLENGDEEEAIDALNYEMSIILNDLQNKDDYWFPSGEVETAKEALQEFYSIIQEYDLDDKVDDWFFSQECQEVALL